MHACAPSRQDIVNNGAISNAQLETVVYANQRFNQRLPGNARAGFFLVRPPAWRHSLLAHVCAINRPARRPALRHASHCACTRSSAPRVRCDRATAQVSERAARLRPSSASSLRLEARACCGCPPGAALARRAWDAQQARQAPAPARASPTACAAGQTSPRCGAHLVRRADTRCTALTCAMTRGVTWRMWAPATSTSSPRCARSRASKWCAAQRWYSPALWHLRPAVAKSPAHPVNTCLRRWQDKDAVPKGRLGDVFDKGVLFVTYRCATQGKCAAVAQLQLHSAHPWSSTCYVLCHA